MISLVSTLFAIAAAAGPTAPTDSLARLHFPADVRVELIAAEPAVIDPVAVAFDELGRMFVVENRGYPEDDSSAGTIALLTDEDGDGSYTHKSTFQDGLNFPNGVMAWNGGVIVTDAPHVLFLRDTTGDGVADVREVLLDGFSMGGSTQLRVSHPTLGLNNWIHFSNGLSGGDVKTPDGSDPVSMGLYDLRFNPFTGELETVGGRAQFGLAFDDFGHKFVCSNRNHIQHVVLSPHDLARNPALSFSATAFDIPDHGAAADVFPLTGAPTTAYAHAGTFTAACGLVIYRGDALPPAYRGNAFVCEPTGNLVHRDVLEPTGSTFVAKRGRPNVEFIASEDEWFRPVFLTNGPGGALYLCDMYRGTIEHPTYLPGEVAAVTDFSAGKDRGRIYRITGIGNRRASAPIDVNTDSLIKQLANEDSWSRDTAHRLLLEQREGAVAPELRALLDSDASAVARVHALSLLSGLGAIEDRDLLAAMSDRKPALRELGIRFARLSTPRTGEVTKALDTRAGDDDSHVRFEAALALGDLSSAEAVDRLVDILVAAPGDRWTEAAVLSGVHGSIGPFMNRYLDASGNVEPHPDTVYAMGSMMARALPTSEVNTLVADYLMRAAPSGTHWKIALLNGAFSRSNDGELSPIDRLKANQPDSFAQQLDALVDAASMWASDTDRSTEERLSAIELLGAASFDSSAETLAALLTPATPAAIQTEAIRSLFRSRDARASSLVLAPDRWNAFTGQSRDAALTGIFSVENGVSLLLDALEAGDAPAWTVPAQYRNRLTAHADVELQSRANAIFGDAPQQDRMAVYESLRSVLELSGNSANGRLVFEKTCVSCHRFGELGHEVGPDLTGIASQSSDSILLHIIVPNWLKLPGYESYLVETDALEEFVGIIVAESEANLTLRAAYGIENTIPRSAITSMKLMALSMMPGALEETMSRQELRDLIAFLKREP